MWAYGRGLYAHLNNSGRVVIMIDYTNPQNYTVRLAEILFEFGFNIVYRNGVVRL
jgi:hypothetical protein